MISFKQYILEQNISRLDGERGRRLTINYLLNLQNPDVDKNAITLDYLNSLSNLDKVHDDYYGFDASRVNLNPGPDWVMVNNKWVLGPVKSRQPWAPKDGGNDADTVPGGPPAGHVYEYRPPGGKTTVLGNRPQEGDTILKRY